MFDKLMLSICNDLLSEVKLEQNAWVKVPGTIDLNKLIANFLNLYTNYKSTKEWDKINDKDATIITLATEMKQLRSQVKSQTGTQHTPAKAKVQFVNPGSINPPAWCTVKVVAKATCPEIGDTFDWCPEHGNANQPKTGMYMPEGHNHDEWFAARKSRNKAWNDKRKKQKETDSVQEEVIPKKKSKDSSPGTLVCSKSFKSALVTKVQMSDLEIDEIIKLARSTEVKD